jgi:hypothetical protein
MSETLKGRERTSGRNSFTGFALKLGHKQACILTDTTPERNFYILCVVYTVKEHLVWRTRLSVCDLTSEPKPLRMCVNILYGNLSLKVVRKFQFWLKSDEYIGHCRELNEFLHESL